MVHISLVYFNWHVGMEYDEILYVKRNPNGVWQDREIVTSGRMYMEEGYREHFPCIAINEDGVIMVLYATRLPGDEHLYYSTKKPNSFFHCLIKFSQI